MHHVYMIFQTTPILQLLVADLTTAPQRSVHRLDVQDDLGRHNCVANQTFPSRLVNFCGMNVLNMFGRLESGLASCVAYETNLLRWSVVGLHTKVIVVGVFCAKLTITCPAVVEISLGVDVKAVAVTIRMVLSHVTLIVQIDDLLPTDLALLEDVRLSNVQMHSSKMHNQIFLAVEELVGAAITLKRLK